MAQPIAPHYPVIDADVCQLCRRCQAMRACRWQAVIRFDRDEPPVIDAGRCTLCWACMDVCKHSAVVVVSDH